jgi:protein-S-isoprenylcysteine O-methyltransferase Ste14
MEIFLNRIIIGTFILQGAGLLVAGYLAGRSGARMGGRATIPRLFFLSGKILLFSSWALFLLKAILPGFGGFTSPLWAQELATLMLFSGSMILVVSFFNLGKSLRVGLPFEETELKTRGFYALSRNPLYLGVFIICIASCIYFPNPLNIAFAVYGMAVHHRIILGEEKFLEERFGEQWREYTKRVRRYL